MNEIDLCNDIEKYNLSDKEIFRTVLHNPCNVQISMFDNYYHLSIEYYGFYTECKLFFYNEDDDNYEEVCNIDPWQFLANDFKLKTDDFKEELKNYVKEEIKRNLIEFGEFTLSM